MSLSDNSVNDDLGNLRSNLYLLASDFESQQAYLSGYSDFGIYQECLEGVREPMANFAAIVRSGKLSLEVIAKIYECYYQMETLARYPCATNLEYAFKSGTEWQHLRQLARQAADLLEDIA